MNKFNQITKMCLKDKLPIEIIEKIITYNDTMISIRFYIEKLNEYLYTPEREGKMDMFLKVDKHKREIRTFQMYKLEKRINIIYNKALSNELFADSFLCLFLREREMKQTEYLPSYINRPLEEKAEWVRTYYELNNKYQLEDFIYLYEQSEEEDMI